MHDGSNLKTRNLNQIKVFRPYLIIKIKKSSDMDFDNELMRYVEMGPIVPFF